MQDPPLSTLEKHKQALPCPAALHSFCLPSPQLFSLQAPLKTLLQLTIMPIINGKHHHCLCVARLEAVSWGLLHLLLHAERTKKGVQIPLPEGMDFTREVVTNHAVREQDKDNSSPSSRHGHRVLAAVGTASPVPILLSFAGISHSGS